MNYVAVTEIYLKYKRLKTVIHTLHSMIKYLTHMLFYVKKDLYITYDKLTYLK